MGLHDYTVNHVEIGEWELPGEGFKYPNGSIYEAMKKAGIPYRLPDIHSLQHFAADLQGPYPYPYTFIEPHDGDIMNNTYEGGSSQHPMDDFYGGKQILAARGAPHRRSPPLMRGLRRSGHEATPRRMPRRCWRRSPTSRNSARTPRSASPDRPPLTRGHAQAPTGAGESGGTLSTMERVPRGAAPVRLTDRDRRSCSVRQR